MRFVALEVLDLQPVKGGGDQGVLRVYSSEAYARSRHPTAQIVPISVLVERDEPVKQRAVRPEFIGDFCVDCGSDKLIQDGTCKVCLACGSRVGGCS